MGFLLKEERENLLVEYNLLREEIWERDYRTWVINAVLIIGSLLVAFVQTLESFPTPVLSIVLVACGLILYITSKRVNAVAYLRMEEIATQLRITGLKKMYESQIAGQWWYALRKNVAYLLFVILLSVYLFLILDNVYVLAITIIIGFLLIFLMEKAYLKPLRTRFGKK
jgi:hypothetical protein